MYRPHIYRIAEIIRVQNKSEPRVCQNRNHQKTIAAIYIDYMKSLLIINTIGVPNVNTGNFPFKQV